MDHCGKEVCLANRSAQDLCCCDCVACDSMWRGLIETATNKHARVLCPRPCADCCCQEHHWGDYGGPDDANGEPDDCDSGHMSCKHCQAELDYSEKCLLCERELIEHDHDTWACDSTDETPMPDKFRYSGQPDRVCNEVHPWDRHS